MQVINTFMHGDRVLRPGDSVPSGVSDAELLAWKNSGLIGENYDGPTRRTQPGPTETKPAAPARKAATPKAPKTAEPKPAETKATSNGDADAQTSSDVQEPQASVDPLQAATDGAAAAPEAKTE